MTRPDVLRPVIAFGIDTKPRWNKWLKGYAPDATTTLGIQDGNLTIATRRNPWTLGLTRKGFLSHTNAEGHTITHERRIRRGSVKRLVAHARNEWNLVVPDFGGQDAASRKLRREVIKGSNAARKNGQRGMTVDVLTRLDASVQSTGLPSKTEGDEPLVQALRRSRNVERDAPLLVTVQGTAAERMRVVFTDVKNLAATIEERSAAVEVVVARLAYDPNKRKVVDTKAS